MKSKYENHCVSCDEFRLSDKREGKFYCHWKNEYHYAFDERCGRYFKMNRTDSILENAYNYSVEYSSNTSGCYLTTMICNILGYDDSCYYLNTLRKFREINKYNINYQQLFLIYDIYGPLIARNLQNDSNNKKVAFNMICTYINEACLKVINNEDEEAKKIYIEMTNYLANLYGISISYNELPNEFNIDDLGHGRYLKLNMI